MPKENQVSQQVFLERPQDCGVWAEMWAAGRGPGQLSLEPVKGNVNPQARSEQTRHPGWLFLDPSLPLALQPPKQQARVGGAVTIMDIFGKTQMMLTIPMVLGVGGGN